MDFKEIVNSNRPHVVSAEEQRQNLNKEISDFVISVAKEDIIAAARNYPQNGEQFRYSGKVYLGTPDDRFFTAIVGNNTIEVPSRFFWKKTYHTSYNVTSNGLELLHLMRSIAQNDSIEIEDYAIGFGCPDRSEHGDYYEYRHNNRFTSLRGAHIHSFPVEVKYHRNDYSPFFLSPETNGEFIKHTLPNACLFPEESIVGVYVRYSYKG